MKKILCRLCVFFVFIMNTVVAFETPYRLLIDKDPHGWSLEMDDGSMWRMSDSSSADEVKHWRANDSLVIHPTLFPYLSGGRYFIVNERVRGTAIAELSYGPLIDRATHNQIVYIDNFAQTLQLQDGAGRVSFWHLNFGDRSLFKQWKLGQTIIIGSNEDCYAGWFSHHPYILINVERNNYVRAVIM